MTRIAGSTRAATNSDYSNVIDQMLRQGGASANARVTYESTDHFSLGIVGPRQVFRGRNLLIALDGYIYNRSDLGDFSSEQEAIEALYRQHGFTQAMSLLNGDFAIALYDIKERSIFLGRDRFGTKPLYYHADGSEFAFASQPGALLALPCVSTEPNTTFVGLFAGSHYRYFDNDPESSPFADVKQLPGAHALSFKNGNLNITRYWTLEQQPDWTDSEAELSERYRNLLLDSVSRRMKVAMGPAFTLSGGMDSSSVLASAVLVTGAKQHAVSTVYRDKTYDESAEIKTILDSCVDQWHQVQLDVPDVFGLVERMIRVHNEPVATATWLSHFLLCENVANAGFRSLFGGLGGDELNAGEFEHFLYFFADLRNAGEDARLQREIKEWIRHHDHPVFSKSPELVEQQLKCLVDLSIPGKCIADRSRMLRYEATLNPDYFDLEKFEPELDHPFDGYLKNRTYQDLVRETIPCCLRAEDRQSVAFGLDNFLPFLDHRLVEFMYRVPTSMKYRDAVTKKLLRHAMKGVLPEETRTRVAKTGWNAPAHVWFSGKGLDLIKDLVRSQRFRERGVYNHRAVVQVIEEHEMIMNEGLVKENHMMFLWQLVNLELWFRAYID